MNKLIAAIMAAIMAIFTGFTSPQLMADAAAQLIEPVSGNVGESGSCGTNAKWTLEGGKLSITGSGNMASWGKSSDVPWYNMRNQISSVTIAEGITSVGPGAFPNAPT